MLSIIIKANKQIKNKCKVSCKATKSHKCLGHEQGRKKGVKWKAIKKIEIYFIYFTSRQKLLKIIFFIFYIFYMSNNKSFKHIIWMIIILCSTFSQCIIIETHLIWNIYVYTMYIMYIFLRPNGNKYNHKNIIKWLIWKYSL